MDEVYMYRYIQKTTCQNCVGLQQYLGFGCNHNSKRINNFNLHKQHTAPVLLLRHQYLVYILLKNYVTMLGKELLNLMQIV